MTDVLADELFGSPWPLDSDHVSATQIAMAMRCLEQYRRRYVLGHKERPGGALVLGGAFHRAQEFNYEQKIETHEDAPVEDVSDVFSDAFEQSVERQGGADEIDWKDNPGALKDNGVLMTEAYRAHVAPTVQPIAAEKEFRLPTSHGLDVLGFIDVETDGYVVDMKTAGRAPTRGEPKRDWRIQELVYQAATAKPMHWHVVTSTKTPGLHTPATSPSLETPYTPGQETFTMKQIDRVIARIVWSYNRYGPDEAWEGGLTHPFACGYCGFLETCSWWGH